jgi:ParB family transcriptional regulator, chromosome partitioning protein
MAKKSALGRGLGALIEDVNQDSQYYVEPHQETTVDAVNEIDMNSIEVNPFQPRTDFDLEGLNELAASIKQLGIIQPITVRKVNDSKYQLISGERRFRASKIAGLSKIPAYVRTADDNTMLELALVENIQREDLNAIEIAIGYQRLIDECNLTQENLSERVGKKRATVANYLRLLKLPAEVQLGLRDKKLSMGHARALVSIDDPKIQMEVYRQVLEQELSVRAIEGLVKRLSEPEPEPERTPEVVFNSDIEEVPEDNTDEFQEGIVDEIPEELPEPVRQEINIVEPPLPEPYKNFQDHLSSRFKSQVELKRNDKGIGKIIIPFLSDDDLERIISILNKING